MSVVPRRSLLDKSLLLLVCCAAINCNPVLTQGVLVAAMAPHKT